MSPRHTAPLDQLIPRHSPATAAQAAGVAPLTDEGGEVSPLIATFRSDDVRAQIERALTGTGVNPDRFLRVVETAMLERPAFLLCSPRLLLAAVLRCAALGLEPNSPLGLIFLEPIDQDGTVAVKAILGYKGMLKLIHRSPEIDSCRVGVVRANDEFVYEQGTSPMLMHRQALEDRGEVKFLYVRWKLAGVAEAEFEIITLEEIEARKAFSTTATDPEGAWTTDELIMQMKTALRIVFPWLPVSADAAAAESDDGIVILEDPEPPPE